MQSVATACLSDEWPRERSRRAGLGSDLGDLKDWRSARVCQGVAGREEETEPGCALPRVGEAFNFFGVKFCIGSFEIGQTVTGCSSAFRLRLRPVVSITSPSRLPSSLPFPLLLPLPLSSRRVAQDRLGSQNQVEFAKKKAPKKRPAVSAKKNPARKKKTIICRGLATPSRKAVMQSPPWTQSPPRGRHCAL